MFLKTGFVVLVAVLGVFLNVLETTSLRMINQWFPHLGN